MRYTTGQKRLAYAAQPEQRNHTTLLVYHASWRDLVTVDQLDAEYRAGVVAMYPGVSHVWLPAFELVESLSQRSSRATIALS